MMAIPAMAQTQAPAAPYASSPRGLEVAQTRDQAVAKVRAHFARMDINRDGFIAGDEMKSRRDRRQAADDPRKERHRQAAFEWLDRNRDNMISREEFSSFREVAWRTYGSAWRRRQWRCPAIVPARAAIDWAAGVEWVAAA